MTDRGPPSGGEGRPAGGASSDPGPAAGPVPASVRAAEEHLEQ